MLDMFNLKLFIFLNVFSFYAYFLPTSAIFYETINSRRSFCEFKQTSNINICIGCEYNSTDP